MKETTLPANYTDVAKNLNSSVIAVIGSKEIEGFEKAFVIANAASELKKVLTSEYMKPILELQGNRLGFKTDKDDKGGYPEPTVKNCLIEAVLTGVQPFGNQFNIIAGNCYITKEGFGYLLKNVQGLSYEVIPTLPRIDSAKGSAAIVMKIKWTIEGSTNEREIDFPIKVNQYMGADAVIGKATRKARAWLFNTVMNTEIADGDVGDIRTIDITPEPTIEDLKLLFDMKKDSLSKAELTDAERIISTNEYKSFHNLRKILMDK